MIIDIRESLDQDIIATVATSSIQTILKDTLEKKEREIQALRDKILKYEQKNRAEGAFYQSLSPLRKLFTGRPPSHHRAVEYMVNVKDRMKKIESYKIQVNELNTLLESAREPDCQTLTISHSLLEELRPLLMTGDRF